MSAAGACAGCANERAEVFQVAGLDCAGEAAVIESCLRGLAGVCSVRASPLTGQATVVHTLEPGRVEAALAAAGFRASPARSEPAPAASWWPAGLAAGLTCLGFAIGWLSPQAARLAYLPAILIGGAGIARKGVQRARQGALDTNALMSVAVTGAVAIGEWGEGATTVALFALAQALEARSLERARRAISSLLSLAPDVATVLRDGVELRVAPAQVAVGELILVRPGECFPLDGSVSSGISEVDQSPLTGESAPVLKQPGGEVFAGSLNGSGALSVRVSRPAAETRLSRIVRRVEEAQSSRAPSQGFVDRFAAVYTPAVVLLAALVAVLPPLLAGGPSLPWVYRALVLLVISCPCALVISTPVSIVSALTAASRRGALIKGGAHLEAIAGVRVAAFDKTGTLTRGAPEVQELAAAPGVSEAELLSLAASVESLAGHPLGRAVVARAAAAGAPLWPAEDVKLIPGRGVTGRVDGRQVLVGSHQWFQEGGLCDHALDGVLERLESAGQTAILVGTLEPGPRTLGVLGLADGLRPDAAETIRQLQSLGVRIALLTGDNAATAAAIAARVGIGDSRAELMPEGKLAAVRALEREGGPVLMVGDGVNDAPALAAASVGAAMGGRGSDAALETADIALLGDRLALIPYLVRLGRRTRRIIAANVALSLLVKAAVLLLALAGFASLWAAVAADMGASLLVIANGLRLLADPRAAPAEG